MIASHLRENISGLIRNQSGIAAIEFAFLGPILAMSMVMAADVGMGFYSDMQVQTAAQVGAEYAIIHGFDATAMANAVTSATPATGITASPAPSNFCGCPSTSDVTTATCGSACSDGTLAGTYAKVTATRTYTTLIPYPMLPASFTQTAVSTVRIQ